MRFFIDNCLPPRWAPALSGLSDPGEYEVVHIRAKFPQKPGEKGIADVDWIRALGAEGGWTIISGDVRITKLAHERAAWFDSGLTAFFLARGWGLPFWEKTVRIMQWWPHVLQQTRMVQPGAGFLVPARVGGGKFEQVPLGRKPPQSRFLPQHPSKRT